MTKRAVEKHINAIFLKLSLADGEDVSKRVKATLMFLSDAEGVDACRSQRAALSIAEATTIRLRM